MPPTGPYPAQQPPATGPYPAQQPPATGPYPAQQSAPFGPGRPGPGTQGFGAQGFGAQGPNTAGAPVRAAVGGGIIAVLAVILIFVFWPVAILLFIVAGVYAFFLATGMPMAAGPQTTIAHAAYAWRSVIAPAFGGRSTPNPAHPGPNPAYPGPNPMAPNPMAPNPVAPAPATPAHPYTAAQASNPATDPQVLSQIAAAAPELRVLVANNPATYPGLLDWLDSYGDAQVKAAVARRRGGF